MNFSMEKKKYLQLNSFFGMKSNTFELDIEWIEIQFNMIDIQDVIWNQFQFW